MQEHILTNDGGQIRWRTATGSVAEITDIYVKPEARRKGYGRQLVEQAMTMAQAAGAVNMYVFSEYRNAPSGEFWQAMGFHNAHCLPGFYPSDTAIIRWRPIVAASYSD